MANDAASIPPTIFTRIHQTPMLIKTVIAYALVVVGVTQLVGMFVGSAITLPIAKLVPYSTLKIRLLPLLEFFNGVAALAVAVTLFWLLGVPISVLLPLIVGAWLTFYFSHTASQKLRGSLRL
jgi:uncharacterized protein YneF (UPF0154 family)